MVLHLNNGTKIACGQIQELNPSLKDFKSNKWVPRTVIALDLLEKMIKRKNKALKVHCVYSKTKILSVYVTEGDLVKYGVMYSINETKLYIGANSYKEAKFFIGDLMNLFLPKKKLTVAGLLKKANKKLREVLK